MNTKLLAVFMGEQDGRKSEVIFLEKHLELKICYHQKRNDYKCSAMQREWMEQDTKKGIWNKIKKNVTCGTIWSMVQPVTGRYQAWKRHATKQNGNNVVRKKRLESFSPFTYIKRKLCKEEGVEKREGEGVLTSCVFDRYSFVSLTDALSLDGSFWVPSSMYSLVTKAQTTPNLQASTVQWHSEDKLVLWVSQQELWP